MSDKYIPYEKKEEFFYKIQSKTNAPFLLNEILQKIPQDCLVIIGTACDPYQPIEKKYKNTRSILEVLYNFKIPTHIMTKSDLILSDIDLLEKMSAVTFLAVSFSIVTNDDLWELLEPRSVKPSKRFKAMSILASRGIRCGAMLAPVIPYIINEKTVSDIVSEASLSGAKYISTDDLRLRDTNKARFLSFIEKFYPQLLRRYEIMYSKRVSPPVIFSKKIADLVEKMAVDFGLDTTAIGEFVPEKRQLELL
ncbi:MAG: hypothetical protein PHE88_10935 [Elusimicrobia bacterium]|nr:hypothetical protein [Elusimicrobiota bacterium]